MSDSQNTVDHNKVTKYKSIEYIKDTTINVIFLHIHLSGYMSVMTV